MRKVLLKQNGLVCKTPIVVSVVSLAVATVLLAGMSIYGNLNGHVFLKVGEILLFRIEQTQPLVK